jgi:hypothetical protein
LLHKEFERAASLLRPRPRGMRATAASARWPHVFRRRCASRPHRSRSCLQAKASVSWRAMTTFARCGLKPAGTLDAASRTQWAHVPEPLWTNATCCRNHLRAGGPPCHLPQRCQSSEWTLPRVTTFFVNRQRSLVALEAFGSAHHWARTLQPVGHEVKLLPTKHVRPFVLRDKTDARDAETIWGQSSNFASRPCRSRTSSSKLV